MSTTPNARRFPFNPRTLKTKIKTPAAGPNGEVVQIDYADDSTPGLWLRVSSNGVWTWFLVARTTRNGERKPQRHTLGRCYTEDNRSGLGLEDARTKAKEVREICQRGEDPKAIEQRRHQEQIEASKAPAPKTIADVLDEHVTRYLKKEGRRTAEHVERTLERLVKPRIGTLGAYDIRRSNIVTMLDEIEDENGPVMADRTLAYVRKAFNWYATRDDRFNTPIVRGMARTKPSERAGARTLADDEIRDLWTALDAMDKPACYPTFIRMLLLTGQRRDEVAGMRWDEIEKNDEGHEGWTIPAARYKTKRDHLVPLTPAMRAIIGGKARNAGQFVISTSSGMQAFSGYSKAKKLLDEKLTELRAKDGRDPMAEWDQHDLRRTARSLMARAGLKDDVAERVLGHVIGGVRGVYNRWAYADEKRDALEKLAALVERILNPPAGNVEDLQKRRLENVAAAV
jgi:integrase